MVGWLVPGEEEEAMDHQVSPEPENSQSETVDGEDESSDQENESNGNTEKAGPAHGRLFSFSMVNSYGTANISPLPCDGNILKLTGTCSGHLSALETGFG